MPVFYAGVHIFSQDCFVIRTPHKIIIKFNRIFRKKNRYALACIYDRFGIFGIIHQKTQQLKLIEPEVNTDIGNKIRLDVVFRQMCSVRFMIET